MNPDLRRNLPPHVPLLDQAGPVASPIATRPAGALIQELGAILQSGFNLAFALILDPSLPLVAHQPSRDKVIVVSIQDPLSPLFSLEAFEEVMALEDFRSVRPSAARHAGSAAVHVVSSRNLKVAALNVCRSEPVPDANRPRGRPLALHSLACADAADLGIFKGGENPGHQRRGPGHIVVSHDGDGSRHSRQSLADLESLVGNVCVHDTDPGVVEGPGQLVKSLALVVRRDQNKLVWLTGQDALKRRSKLLKRIMNSRNNDRDVVVGKGWLARDRLRFVGPMADAVNKQPDISMEPSMRR